MGHLRERCLFQTGRLTVGDWDGSLGYDRAAFIGDSDHDSTTLLASKSTSGHPIGLLILFEDHEGADGGSDVRIGYLVAENAWGQGYGSEVVAGFVQWCRQRTWVRSLAGGVDPSNIGSVLVLTRNGFVQQASTGLDAVEYRLEL